jgi:biotin synthase-related radical SAM superfamily protein
MKYFRKGQHMPTAELLEPTTEQKKIAFSPEKEAAKQILLDELLLHFKLTEHGVRFNRDEIRKFENPRRSQFNWSGGNAVGPFYLPHGISGAHARYNQWTPYSIVVEDDQPVLYDENRRLGVIKFHQPWGFEDELLSDGHKFSDIAHVEIEGQFGVAYSNECSLQDKGETCFFCGINVRTRPDGTRTEPFLKSAKQIAEAYAVARKHGTGNQFKISGGFIPERRELEYYLDVVELLTAQHKNNYIDTVIGCPEDISVLDKYKEAGVKVMDLHLEIWDKNIFAALLPGKNHIGEGWQHWVEATEHAVELFGKGFVHSKIVAGLEPKQSVLEGVEYFASKGVVMKVGAFSPRPGTPLEGTRTPSAEWHWDLVQKVADIWHRYGFTSEHIHAGSHPGRRDSDAFEIKSGNFEGDYLPLWQYPPLGD